MLPGAEGVHIRRVELVFRTMARRSVRQGFVRWGLSAVCVVAVASVATPALAANKSLPVAVASLPNDIQLIASLDATIARSTKLYSSTMPLLLSMSGSAETGLDEVKKTCGFDPLTSIDDITMAMDSGKNGAAFIGVNITESAFTSCLVSLAKQKSGADVTTSKSGNEITVKAPSGTFYFAWLPGDVIALTKNPRDQKELARFTGGGGALASNKQMSSWLSMADPSALATVVTTRSFSGGGMSMDGGVASLVYKGGSYEAKATIEVGSKSRAELAEKGATLLKTMLANKGPAELQSILGTLEVKASGTTVVAKASGSESDVTAILGWAMKGMP